jgi:hypothetical protein
VSPLFTVYLVVTAITVAANAGAAVADARRAPFVLASMAEVGVPRRWLPPLAALKAAGAAGLLVGTAGVLAGRPAVAGLAVAAATGLVLFFTGALLVHVRARALRTLPYPGVFWLLALTSLVLALVVRAGGPA